MFKLVARMRGWQEAYDYDLGVLVVWHPSLKLHYTGPKAWRYAALHRFGKYNSALTHMGTRSRPRY